MVPGRQPRPARISSVSPPGDRSNSTARSARVLLRAASMPASRSSGSGVPASARAPSAATVRKTLGGCTPSGSGRDVGLEAVGPLTGLRRVGALGELASHPLEGIDGLAVAARLGIGVGKLHEDAVG